MNSQAEVAVYIFMIVVLVPILTYALVKQIWNQPLRSGRGYFLGVEVPAGFYDGPGRTWLKWYHATVAALYLVWAAALAAIVVSGRWEMTPMWAGGFALTMVPTLLAFQAWTRRRLGSNPPVRAVAVPLESWRFSDYISWPMEGLAMAVVALSWWLLLRDGRPIDWRGPLLLSWVALGLLPGKITVVRSSALLPAEETAEHYRYQDARRRRWLSLWGAFGWFFVAVLFSGALLHALSPFQHISTLRWIALIVFFGGWGWQMVLMFRGVGHLRAMYGDLRPAGSWKSPFNRSSDLGKSREFQVWFAIWLRSEE